MSIRLWWNDRLAGENRRARSASCLNATLRINIPWNFSGIEPKGLWYEASDYLPEPWHCLSITLTTQDM